MATWEDGPEYAPVQRPTEFAPATVAPLENAPPVVNLAAGLPDDRPAFDQPHAPVAALADLVPPVPDQRDPHQAFDVVTSSVTDSTSVWGSVHWTAPTAPESWPAPAAAPVAAAAWPDPTGQPFPPPAGAPDPYGGYPAPGTTQWFAPPPPAYGPMTGAPVTAKAVLQAATPGVLICLVVAGLIYPLAPVVIVIALVLASRVTVARNVVRLLLGLLVGVLVLAALVGVARMALDLLTVGEVWTMVARWGQVCAWPTLVGVVAVVWRALRTQGAPPRPTTWA